MEASAVFETLVNEIANAVVVKLSESQNQSGRAEKSKEVYLNKGQASAYLGVSRHSLEEMILDGLPFHKVGGVYRISSAELDDWLLKH